MAWLLFPLALFPLAALLTYDWRTITALCMPPVSSSNWIGPLGDHFAYYGYMLFGLAIWIVPVICVIAATCAIAGRKMRAGRRELWFLVFLTAISCLVQVLGTHAGPLADWTRHLNIANSGGAIGYLIMTRLLTPLLNDFGASVLVVVVMLIALVAAVGVHNLRAFLAMLLTWVITGSLTRAPKQDEEETTPTPDSASEKVDDPNDLFAAARRAREEVKRQREAEKAQLKAEKQRLKESKQREKEAARQEKDAAKEAAKLALERARHAPNAALASNESGVGVSAGVASDEGEEEKQPYILPPISLLNPLEASKADHSDVSEMSQRLIDTLKIFNVDATLSYTVPGPVVTKYAIELTPGTRYSAVTNISKELMGALNAKSIRIEAPIPGEDRVGIEVPNRKPAGICFREIFESSTWRTSKAELPLLFGKDAAGKELVADLATMPHMLVAGATGQGKSVCLNAIINGLLMTRSPEQLKLIMVDPKSVEFTAYSSLPHLLVPVITDNRKVVFSLHWAVAEMEKRLKLFARARVRNIRDFNHRNHLTQTDMFGDDQAMGSDMPRTVPYIVIIIDEVADLMSQCAKDVTPDISRLTAKARAAGIHLILATQRPDAKVITGTIKANIPGRVAFKTSQAIDSRTILDETGAENLIGRGDMLFKGKDGILTRAQGAWITDEEIGRITSFIEQHSKTEFDAKFSSNLDRVKEAGIEDPFAALDAESPSASTTTEDAAAAREQVKADENAADIKKAIECIINTNRASTSHFQRKLGWGYNHAAKIMDDLEDMGVIGPQSGAGPRPIVMEQSQLLAIFNGDASADSAAQIAADAQNDVTDVAPSNDPQDPTEEQI